MNNDKTYIQALDELRDRSDQKMQTAMENATSYQYSPDEPIWSHSDWGNPVKATFVKYNKKTVTIIVHFNHAGDCRQYVKVNQISPRNTGGNE